MIINYKNETFTTKYDYEILSDDEFEYLKKEYYKKPSFEQVKKEMINISKGGSKNTYITNYYVRDLMDKTKIFGNKWCIEDVFNHKPLLSYFWARTKMNDKVFLPNEKPRRKLDTAFRIGGRAIAGRVSNFPIKTVNYILERYNVNNNYYDFSCGWGARLISALKNNVNYFGTDPNYLLTDRLENLANDYKNIINTKSKVDIRTQGSEIFNPDWENKIGLAFSSPPYFYLEDYKIGKQSYTEGMNYENWLNDYLKPTIRNIYYYLIDEGYFLINIKNVDEFNLVYDTLKIANEIGFTLIDVIELKRVGKPYIYKKDFVNNNEKIMCFCKGNDTYDLSDLD